MPDRQSRGLGRRAPTDEGNSRRAVKERWRQNFNDCREARGLTHEEIARRAGVSVGAVRKWGQGESVPALETAIHLADILQVARVRVLDWAGYVPGVADLTLYVEQLQAHLSRCEESLRGLSPDLSNGLGQIVDALTVNGRYSFRVVPWWRGTGVRACHFADWIVFEHGHAGMTSASIEADIRHEFILAAAYWDGREDWSHILTPPREDLVLCVPRFHRSRRGNSPLPGPYRSIVILGQHWCGHTVVANFVARAVDYDFSAVGLVAASVYGSLPHDWDADGWLRDRREVTRTYTLDAELGRHRTWSADIWEDTECLAIATSTPRLPFVVYLRPTDEVIEYAAHMRLACRMTELSSPTDEAVRIRRIRREAEQLLLDRAGPPGDRYVIVDVELPRGVAVAEESPAYGVDAWFDQYADIADQVLSLVGFAATKATKEKLRRSDQSNRSIRS